MYNASATFKNLIKEDERLFYYSGTIVTTGGNEYDFTGDDMRSGKITRSICDSDKLQIGTVYASEFDCELNLDVSRYELYGGTITLNIELEGAEDAIPMGTFIISEVSQTMDRIRIKSYDSMIKFDSEKFNPQSHTSLQLPYSWLTEACEVCGVTLGHTVGQIKLMPNGKRSMGYADVANDVKTWRDVVGYIAAALGGYAYIGRDSKLYIGSYKSEYDDTIPSSFRYSSGLSDYRTTFNGIYGLYKPDALQEYTENDNEDGLVLDIGANPFLQFSAPNARRNALKEIIKEWNDVYYVPFNASLPMNPLYDPGDVLKFTDNQAGEYDIGVITEIVVTIGGQMSVKCSGDNPRLAEAQDRFTKTVAGISSEYSNTCNVGNKDYWKLSITNTEAITASDTEVEIAEIEWHQSTIIQDIEMILTIDAELSATAEVQLRLTVDDEEDYEYIAVEDKLLKGTRILKASNPQLIEGVGDHVAKVYMTVTDSALTVGDLR